MHKHEEKDTNELLAGLWNEAEQLAEKCDTKATREKLDEIKTGCGNAGLAFDKLRADAVHNRAEINNLVSRLDEESRKIRAAAESGKPVKKLADEFEYIEGRLDAEIVRAKQLSELVPGARAFEKEKLEDYLRASSTTAFAARALDNYDIRIILSSLKETEKRTTLAPAARRQESQPQARKRAAEKT